MSNKRLMYIWTQHLFVETLTANILFWWLGCKYLDPILHMMQYVKGTHLNNVGWYAQGRVYVV